LVAGLAARNAVDTVLEVGGELSFGAGLGAGLGATPDGTGLTGLTGLTGPLLAREVAAALGPGEALVAGSSNAIRDLDLAARPFPEPQTPSDARVVLANRGLAGIDGTLSTACGAALARSADGRPTPVRALVGDLTFLHDATGLVSGPFERLPQVQVVLLDDGGGGIFGLLEPGGRAARSAPDAAVYERVFATPTGTDLPALCTAVGATYAPVTELGELREALAKPEDGVSVLHIRADRSARAALADAIADAVRVAMDATIVP
jgi:2-succinyl-5-enolpyruvyl-6-hydroxy-3-cyclohexene-1-carboxylate synthase